MKTVDLSEYLSSKTYPGRGVAMGLTPDGKKAAIAYFIMGRSENSRNRIFLKVGENVKTEAFDPRKMKDPSLIIYYPVRVYENMQIVTNGDQTDTIYKFLEKGECFTKALKTRRFEPDEPNFTPRISGIFDVAKCGYKLSILKCADGKGEACSRYTFDYSEPVAGVGHIIHTYVDDGSPIPSFEGEPVAFATENDIDAFADKTWNALNDANKVSLFVRYIDVETGKTETKIINKLK